MRNAAPDTPLATLGSPPSWVPDGIPPRIGYVLKMFPRFSETFILNEILELERRGIPVCVFSMKAPNEPVRQPGVARVRGQIWTIPPWRGSAVGTHLGCHLRCLLGSPGRYLRTFLFAAKRGSSAAWSKFSVAPFIAVRARVAGVEHLHAHFASGPARQAKFASMLSSIPFSFTAHAKDLFWAGHQHGKNNKLKKRVRQAAYVVAISEYNRRFVHSLGFKVPRRRVVTVYNGLDLDRWPFLRPDGQPLGNSDGAPPLILAVGRLVPKKGFDVLIEACRLLAAQGQAFRCVIAGEGPEGPRLRQRIADAQLEAWVELPGSVPQDRLIEGLYRQATVLVQPSVVAADGDQDGIPTVILEALAIGLPVIATPVSGIGEAVVDGETGLLVPPNDDRALHAAIDRILTRRDLRARLASGGRQLAERRFSLRQNVKVLIHLLDHSARGTRLWSRTKLREKVGLDHLPPEAPEVRVMSEHGR
jgi:glycosyltransferase involved in cell wall biosynthesis